MEHQHANTLDSSDPTESSEELDLKVNLPGIFRCRFNRNLSGYVVSDWGATHDTAALNANGGLEMEQPGDYLLIGKQ